MMMISYLTCYFKQFSRRACVLTFDKELLHRQFRRFLVDGCLEQITFSDKTLLIAVSFCSIFFYVLFVYFISQRNKINK